MLRMRRSVRQKVVGGAAVAVLLAGGAFAAVSATGQRNEHPAGNGHPAKHTRDGARRVHARHGARHLRPHDLSAAASYLGTSTAALSGELRTGKSLAQIVAAQGAGKTASGLVEAIVAERKARLAKSAARLPKRISRLVARKFARSASP